MKKLKVLLHVNENDRWKVALGNAENVLKSVGEEGADIVIIGNGESVISYEQSPLLDTMKALAEKGVTFLACRNSMKKMKEVGKISITEDQLPAFVRIVPAGIVAIIEKQNEGYAYVKP
ncbi:MAG: DsrE family protein [Nitrospirae bacterium]|nr:DsrE family protein [Nitrospirota bacterium]